MDQACMCFDIENSLVNTDEIRHIYQIQHANEPYHSLYGENILKRFNNPLQNGGHKIKCLGHFIENNSLILKKNTNMTILSTAVIKDVRAVL